MNTGPDNDQRGEIVQTAFQSLCLEAGATANRPQRDKFGWDVHATLHVPADRGSLELRDTERRLKIQAKSRTMSDWSVPLRVSNAERMAKEEVPWFLLIGRFPVDAVKVEEFFLVHVDDGFISLVLKRLRELDRKPGARANDYDITIPFDESHRIRSGDELRSKWLEHLLPTERAYNERKHGWRESVGYGDAPYRGTMRVKARSTKAMFESMAAWSLGLAPLKVDYIEISKERFGIADPPVVQTHDATLDAVAPPSRGIAHLEFWDDANEERAAFDLTTHTTAEIPGMPLKHHRIQLVCPLLEVTLHELHKPAPSMTLAFAKPALDAELDIQAAQHIGALIAILRNQPRRGLRVSIDVPTMNLHWEFASGNVPSLDDPAVEQFALTARAAARLLAEFGFVAGGTTTSVRALIHDWLGINIVAAARRSDPQLGALGFDVGEERPPVEMELAYASRIALPTSRGTLVGLAVLVGEVAHPSAKTRIELRKPRVGQTMLKLVAERDRARVESEIDAAIADLRRAHVLVVG